jgi:hypothetical protein
VKEKSVEKLAWGLIYSGLLFASVGTFLRHSSVLGWALVGVGATEVVAGVVLIVLRSRMKP